MGLTSNLVARKDALRRAADHSPFLREGLLARPDIGHVFAATGAQAAAEAAFSLGGDNLDVRLRRQRHALALAVALGDLSGEMPLEGVTRLLSDFADRAIDQAIAAAIAGCGECAPRWS